MKRISLFILMFHISAKAQEISLSFDDAPMRSMSLYSGLQRTDRLIKILKNHNVKVVFFSNSSKLNKFNGKERMSRYAEEGHLIANHTHKHLDLRKVTVEEYIGDIEKAGELLKKFPTFKKWFRYPYLAHGNSTIKRDKVRTFLSKKGYENGYVTIDTQDWFMASLVNRHIQNGGKIDEKRLCKAYSGMLWDTIDYFHQQSLKHLGRSPKHMILLHENDLAALCLEVLVKKIKSQKWKIISPESAMKDPIYAIKPKTMNNNDGQVSALIHEKKGIEIADPWSHPWNDGKLIKDEFEKRKVFIE